MVLKTSKTTRKPKTTYEHKPDGDAAKLPLEMWRAPIFQIANQNTLQKAQEKTVTVEERSIYARTITNEYGDRYTIYSSDLLRPTPDMNVLLGLIALFQYEIYSKEKFDENKSRYDITLPMTALYEQLGFSAKHKDRLIASLERIGSICFVIKRKKARAGEIEAAMRGLFEFEIRKRQKGEKSDRIRLSMNCSLFPKEHYLFRSSVLCAMLKSDIAKLIFWLMCSRSHLKVTTKELYDMLFTDDDKVVDNTALKEWRKKRLKPAIAELKKIGWFIKFDEKTKEWTFKIPMSVADKPEQLAEAYIPQPA